MFAISFKKSRSKNYKQVLDLVVNFDDYKIENEVHKVRMAIKELFQKWEFFNLLFWRTVDWKGSSFSFYDIELYSHCDRTRIFYALQQSHSEWINMYIDFAKNMYAIYKEEKSIEEAKTEVFKEKEIDGIIDRFLRNVGRKEYYQQFGHLNFEAPLANSDFYGRRIRKMIKDKQEEEDNEIKNL